MFQLQGLDHIALAVREVERSAQWYIDVLGFERLHDGMWDGIPVFVGKGDAAIALFPIRANERASSTKAAAAAGSTSSSRDDAHMLHFALRANRENFLAAQHELKRRGIKFEFQDHEISHSIYFRDPDGHQIEITTYELPRKS